MSLAAVEIEAIIPAAGQGTRLGLGPKAFVEVAGRTLLEHAVTTMLSVEARASVAVSESDQARAKQVVGGPLVNIVAGGARRIDTIRALVGAATAPWLVLHDIVHPFVTRELAQRVIDEAARVGAAAAALSNVDFLYGKDGAPHAAPGEVLAIQKPIAFRRADALRGFAAADRAAAGGLVADVSVLRILALADQCVAFVPGHTSNYKLTTLEDLELAQRLMAPQRISARSSGGHV
jgi:2-C-methyl-D-erythritol 4-phosphate cytidylyltransferase